MFDSANDVRIEGGKFLDVARNYVYHEHHYQSPEFVWSVNIYPSAEASRLRCSESVFDGDHLEYSRDEAEIAVLKFLGYEVADVDDPRIKLQRRIQELHKKRGANSHSARAWWSESIVPSTESRPCCHRRGDLVHVLTALSRHAKLFTQPVPFM